MSILNQIIEKIAALLIACGCPAGESTLLALILIYLLVTGFIAVPLVYMLVRRRNRERKRVPSPPDRES